ncbi:thiamine diphosphokinase [Yoonia litorea]|uniref:Thiamine diphosphokinase n=1 Tax=Yoonia litorea TaxID=1123755 RepID=A0A1I6MGK6_9RHOB|nr:thiamine diphosphokinase [Yoonia litorea]SFS14855.1 thiamine diphosphokinase [Yoonia litorea]
MPFQSIVSNDRPICLVGGARISKAAFSAVSAYAKSFVAVDSGADFLLSKGILPERVIGDLDSISDEARVAFSEQIFQVAEQSSTDFEKALSRVDAPYVFALGFTGGRLDHTLAVLDVMLRLSERPVILVDQDDASFLARAGTVAIDLPQKTRISVMPVAPVDAVTLSGVQWPFESRAMAMGGFSSPSNEAVGGKVVLTSSAPVLVTLPLAQLAAAVTTVAREG